MQNISVIFTPETHTYTDNLGRSYISVTQLLQKAFPFNKDEVIEKIIKSPFSKYFNRTKEDVIQEWDEISIQGTRVHKSIEDWIKENKSPEEHDETFNCCEQFKALQLKVHASEFLLFNEPLRIAGTCDLIIDKDSHYEIWDIKTNNKINEDKIDQYSIQINLYKYFAQNILNKPVKAGKIVHFENFFKNRSKTKMKIIDLTNVDDQIYEILQDRKKELLSK